MHPVLKRLLRYSFDWLTVPIWGGPLKGRRWGIVTGGQYLRGTHTPEHTAAFQEMVHEGDVVYDLGAHVGYYSVLASVTVGPGGRVVCFEPLPTNLRHLRRHLSINGCDNVTVIDACVSDCSGAARFERGAGTATGRMAEDGALGIQTVTLDDLVRDGTIPPPNCMKVNVEGAEHTVLKGAEWVIATAQPTILLSVHGDDMRRQCSDLLTARGYRLRPVCAPPVSVAEAVLAESVTPGAASSDTPEIGEHEAAGRGARLSGGI